MSSPTDVKRRRLNNASATLTKPFVSPMRSRQPQRSPMQDALIDVANAPTLAYVPSMLAHSTRLVVSQSPTSDIKVRPDNINVLKTSPIRRHMPSESRVSVKPSASEIAVQKAITSIEMQIKSVRNDIDTLEQGAKLRTSNTDRELEELTLKWRLAAQSAADELFGTVKERINRMGGVTAWREMEKAKHDRCHGLDEAISRPEHQDDADCEFDSQGEELPEKEQEYRKVQKRRIRREAMDAAEPDENIDADTSGRSRCWEESGSDDDSFTMDMMLRTLNIELAVIGYDREREQWLTN